jgi:DNA-binding response OmpR family regulator
MRLQVLAVEPSRAVASELAAIFDPARYAFMWAADLAAGRTTLPRISRLHLVVLDAVLPDGDGLDLCRQIKRARPTRPVVVLPAEAGARGAARAAGADLFLEKPLDVDAFRAATQRLPARAELPVKHDRAG